MFINYPLGFTFYFAYYSGVLYSDSQLTIQRKATGSRGERKQKLSSVIRNDKKNKHNNIKTLRQKQQNPHLLKKKKKKRWREKSKLTPTGITAGESGWLHRTF